MGRLIDADSVKRGIEELKQSPWYNEKNFSYFSIRKEAVEVVEHLCIDKEPTIDAKPVKHGRWVKNEEGDFHCSVCKAIVESDEKYRHYWRYCYNCGAIMELEEMMEWKKQ